MECFWRSDQTACGRHTPLCSLLEKEALIASLTRRVSFLHGEKRRLCVTTMITSSTCPRSFMRLGGCHVFMCVRIACAPHSLLPHSFQCPAADARQMRVGPSRKAPRAVASSVFRPVYFIRDCVYIQHHSLFRQMPCMLTRRVAVLK